VNAGHRCDAFRVDLAAHLYGDLPDDAARALESHLKGCAGCREELRGLQRASAALDDQVMFPHESEVDWDAIAGETVRRALGAGRGRAGLAGWFGQILRSPGWSAAAAVALLVAGIAIGLGGSGILTEAPATGPRTVEGGLNPRIAETNLIPAAMLADISATTARAGTRKYLKESRGLLTSLLAVPMRCGEDTVDIAAERKKSLQLLRRQRLIADQLESLPLARAREVSLDLEELFMEILSLSDCARTEQITHLRNLVEKRQLMLRLELLADEMDRSGGKDV
jgi:hypothetical protein